MIPKRKIDTSLHKCGHVVIVLNDIRDELPDLSVEINKAYLCSIINIAKSMRVEFLTLLGFEGEQTSSGRSSGFLVQIQNEKENWFRDYAVQPNELAGECFSGIDDKKSQAREVCLSAEPSLRFNVIPCCDGRGAIVSAIRRTLKDVEAGIISVSDISADKISLHVIPVGFPDPDLIIFTGGVRTLNNSLLWQCVVSGTAEVTVGDKTFLMTENESTYIPIGATHRLGNPGKLPAVLVEVQSGAYLGEDDIVRVEDDFNREKDT